MSATEKYKEFRNYMCNELGITRQDIEAWTKQAVANEIEKKLGQINIEGMVERSVTAAAREAVGVTGWNGGADKLREALAKELVKGLRIIIPATA